MTYASEVLADSPAGYWRQGDSGPTLTDSSGNGRDGSYVGLSAQVTGLVHGDTDKAHSFASGSRGVVADAAWEDAPSFTVIATITPSTVSGTQTIVARYDGFTSGIFNNSSFVLRLNGNKLECHIFVGNTPGAAQTVATLSAGTTYDVAATYDGTTVKVYINGGSAVSATRAGMNNASMPLTIGSTNGTAEAFGGVIDEVAYIGSVLTASDLATLSTTRSSGSGYAAAIAAFSPLAYYRLNDGPALGLADSSGNGHHGTYTAVTVATGALIGDTDPAFTFNGSTSHADVPYASWMDAPTALSIEAWIKTSATGIRSFADRDSSGSRVFQFRTNDGALEFVKISGSVVGASQAASINDGSWHHAVATYDGSNIRLYKDGVLINTTPAAGTLTGSDPLTIGANFGGTFQLFNGDVDEVAYYNTVLSGTRIAAHYTAGTTSPGAVSGTGSLSLSGTAAATAPAGGSGSISLSGTGSTAARVAGSGSLTFSGTGVIDFQPASGSGSIALSGTGATGVGVAGTGSLALSGAATAAGATAASGTGSLTLTGFGSATLAAAASGSLSLGAVAAAFALFVTDLTNAMNGRRRNARGTATVTRATAPPPAGRTFSKRYDKAIAYPRPDMVDGRPT